MVPFLGDIFLVPILDAISMFVISNFNSPSQQERNSIYPNLVHLECSKCNTSLVLFAPATPETKKPPKKKVNHYDASVIRVSDYYHLLHYLLKLYDVVDSAYVLSELLPTLICSPVSDICHSDLCHYDI